MQTAKIFMNGRSQAVRLPKAFRFKGTEVIVKRIGDVVMLFPRRYSYRHLKAALDGFDEGLRIVRHQPSKADIRPPIR